MFSSSTSYCRRLPYTHITPSLPSRFYSTSRCNPTTTRRQRERHFRISATTTAKISHHGNYGIAADFDSLCPHHLSHANRRYFSTDPPQKPNNLNNFDNNNNHHEAPPLVNQQQQYPEQHTEPPSQQEREYHENLLKAQERQYKKKQVYSSLLYLAWVAALMAYIYRKDDEFKRKKMEQIEALLELLKRLERDESVKELHLQRLINDVALPVGRNPVSGAPIFSELQVKFFTENPLVWRVMWNLALNDTNQKKRRQFESLIRGLLTNSPAAAASFAEHHLSDVISRVDAADLSKQNLQGLTQQTKTATAVLLDLLSHRSTHQYFTLQDVEQLKNMLQNKDFYRYFLRAQQVAASEKLPPRLDCPLLLKKHTPLKETFYQCIPEQYSLDELKNLIESNLNGPKTLKDESMSQILLMLLPAAILPGIQYGYHRKRMPSMSPMPFRIRAVALMLALAMSTFSFQSTSFNGEMTYLASTLISLRLGPSGTLINVLIQWMFLRDQPLQATIRSYLEKFR